MNPSIQLRRAIPLFVVALACFGLSPESRAVTPAPDGGYPGGNTAEGDNALLSLTGGTFNTALGFQALLNNTDGGNNTATGAEALQNNTGNGNTATGNEALRQNTTGGHNTADGYEALATNTTGSSNTAVGVTALALNTGGDRNTAVGVYALGLNNTGNRNTAEGFHALIKNTTGSYNIAIGNNAGSNLTNGSNNIDIGNTGIRGEANTIRVGTTGTHTATFIAGISGVTVSGGVGVIIDASGQLGTTTSSARFKKDIKPMGKASEAIYELNPTTFHYKEELDANAIPQFGLVAEEVLKKAPELVLCDDEGKPYTVRYEAVNAMLLNEFLKEHKKVEALQAGFAQQQKNFQAMVAQQQKQIEALTAGLQSVSAQLEMSKPAPHVAEIK
jgi:hypothetical protein